MILFIYVCILVLNILAVFLTYRFLGDEMEKKDRWISVIIGIAIIYMLVTVVYWVSTKNIDLGGAESTAQNLITFSFVPVNGILVLPFLASSYRHFKLGNLKSKKFKNRLILITVVLFIILTIEFFYFKDIGNGILNIISAKK